jgi:hypothetical protein
MHGELTASIQNGLGIYYLLVVILNLGFAAYQHYGRKDSRQGLIWTIVAGVFFIHAVAYFLHSNWVLSSWFRDTVTRIMGIYGGQMGPILYTLLSVVLFALFLRYRKPLTEPITAWAILNIFLLVSGWSMTDPNFRLIITKEDNVPITMLIFTVGFFTWLPFRLAVLNDERLAKGDPPLELLEFF